MSKNLCKIDLLAVLFSLIMVRRHLMLSSETRAWCAHWLPSGI